MADLKHLCHSLLHAMDTGNRDLEDHIVCQIRTELAEPEPKGPTDAETEPAIEPVQPPGRNGMTWQQVIQGLRDVLADESEDAVQRVWQRSRICDAVDLMEANSAALAEPEPEGPTPSDEELRDLWSWSSGQDQGPWPTQYHCFARAVLARWGRPAPQATVKDCLTDQSTDTQVAQLVRMLGDLAAEAELADQTRDVFVLDRAINMLKRLSLPQPS